MKNTIYAIIVAAIIGFLVALHAHGDHQGYDRAKLEYAEIANKALQEAAEKLLVTQGEVTTITDLNNEAKLNEIIKSTKLNATIKKLRDRHTACVNDYSAYRLFNEAANSQDLPKSNSVQIPDEEKDSLDAIQYTVREYNVCAIQLNTVTDILGTLECVSVAD